MSLDKPNNPSPSTPVLLTIVAKIKEMLRDETLISF